MGSQDRLLSRIEDAACGLIIADSDGRVREANPAALGMTGTVLEELTRRYVGEFLSEELTAVRGGFVARLRACGHVSGQLPLLSRTGQNIQCSVTATRLAEDRDLWVLSPLPDDSALETSSHTDDPRAGFTKSVSAVASETVETRPVEGASGADSGANRVLRLRRLADLSLRLSGEPRAVFTDLARLIAELFEVRLVALTEIVGPTLQFRAVYRDGEIVADAGAYPLADTPCATICETKDVRVYDRVAERFPLAAFLQEHRADAYCGFPALDAEQRVIAVGCLLDDRPRSFTDEDMQILRVVGQRIAIEIERNRTQEASHRDREALCESEERLRILVENAPVGIAMFDHELRYIAYSRRWLTDFRLGSRNVIGRHHDEVFPNTPEHWKQVNRRCLTGVPGGCNEQVFEWADGTIDYIRREIQPWRNATGEVGGLVVFSELITDRVLAQRALQASEKRLAEAQRIARLGNWEWHIGSDVLTWSDEVYRIFGHEPQTFTPRYRVEFLNAVHPADRASVMAAVDDALRTGHPYLIEHRICRSDESERVVREQGEVEFDGSGQAMRMYGTVQDITESKRADEQLRVLREEAVQAARQGAIGEVAAGIAHELNQPLAAVANYAFTIGALVEQAASANVDRLQQQCIPLAKSLEAQVLRAGDLVRRMRDLVRKQAGDRERIDVKRPVDEALLLLAGELRRWRINLELDMPADLPMVLIDPIQIQQVVFNLCRNAVEAMQDHPEGERCLRIAAQRRDHDFVLLSVRDGGPGISPDIQSRLFEAFVTSKREGLGLGLAICRRIIEAHGGRIQACTGNFGAEFCFTLPVALEDS